jgi:mannose-6-phosphate isomerase
MTELYPLRFETILKEKVWGGTKLFSNWGKNGNENLIVGESWEISGLPGEESIVVNGFLAGNSLNEILEVYMGDITGDTVYEKYGDEFPLLVKFIDASNNLSVQVHPNDTMATKLHHAYGKSEMWYILSADEESIIYCGFVEGIGREDYKKAMQEGTLQNILNKVQANAGDVFWLPAGTIHAIGSGIVLAEIQQSSDVTYRIFDWNRTNSPGNTRELHTDLAEEALDFENQGGRVSLTEMSQNSPFTLVKSEYFTTNILSFDDSVSRDYNLLDSFVIYICVNGSSVLHWEAGTEALNKGDSILLPATVRNILLEPKPACTILEVYINNQPQN